MAILRVRRASASNLSIDREKVVRAEETWTVETDNPATNKTQILAHPAIPRPFEAHDQDPRALAEEPRVEADTNVPTLFHVRVPFSSEVKVPERDENPLKWPASIVFQPERVTVPAWRDADKQPLLNTAGDLIQGLTVDVTIVHAVVTKNVSRVPDYIFDYSNTCNSDGLKLKTRTFQPFQLAFELHEIPDQYEQMGKHKYLPLTFTLRNRLFGWKEFIPNRGFNEKVKRLVTDINSTYFAEYKYFLQEIRVKDANGIEQEPTEPVWLDKNGKAFRDKDGNVRLPEPKEMIFLEKLLLPGGAVPYRNLPLK